MLGRVSLIDKRGQVLYNAFVKPTSAVESYRTATTGLDASYFVDALPFQEVQVAVAAWLNDRIVVGYQLWLDFQVLGLSHPAGETRDVALYLPFRNTLDRPNDLIGLESLIWLLMRRKIQAEYQDPLENARAALDLYRSEEKQWERTTSAPSTGSLPPPSAMYIDSTVSAPTDASSTRPETTKEKPADWKKGLLQAMTDALKSEPNTECISWTLCLRFENNGGVASTLRRHLENEHAQTFDARFDALDLSSLQKTEEVPGLRELFTFNGFMRYLTRWLLVEDQVGNLIFFNYARIKNLYAPPSLTRNPTLSPKNILGSLPDHVAEEP
ncbi:hypothetical protein FRB96_008905 [Tulasnella sp. 330]|nr:hypothetical protein FRB96_008905 [Tulasnella sp. 330]KAG8883196.1 hypothetical protein FRB97_007018 [Tulasnella sp. 331]